MKVSAVIAVSWIHVLGKLNCQKNEKKTASENHHWDSVAEIFVHEGASIYVKKSLSSGNNIVSALEEQS